MDIFTNVLTRVVPVPIKGEKLRVKALLKEPATNALSDDMYHLEDHEQFYLVKEKSKNKRKEQAKAKNSKQQEQQKQQAKQSTTEQLQQQAKDIKPSEDVIIHKDEIIHPKDHHPQDDDDIQHLDVFV